MIVATILVFISDFFFILYINSKNILLESKMYIFIIFLDFPSLTLNKKARVFGILNICGADPRL